MVVLLFSFPTAYFLAAPVPFLAFGPVHAHPWIRPGWQLPACAYAAAGRPPSPSAFVAAEALVAPSAVVAWSANLQTQLKTSFKAGALLGRGSGEALQVSFYGQGFVIVQPSEGIQVATTA